MPALFNPQNSIRVEAKPFPVLLLLDTSSSMDAVIHITNMRVIGHKYADGQEWNIVDGDEVFTRISELNRSVEEMLQEFSGLCKSGTPVTVGVISFNSVVTQIRLDGVHTFTPADKARWEQLTTDGETCLGGALSLAKQLMEDKSETPGHAYRPLVILVSDGAPTDNWREPLDRFIHDGRSSRCDRMAMMVGEDSSAPDFPDAIKAFAEGTGNEPVYASKVEEISRFFKFITMSVSARSCSTQSGGTPRAALSLQQFISCADGGDTAAEDYDPFES